MSWNVSTGLLGIEIGSFTNTPLASIGKTEWNSVDTWVWAFHEHDI